MLYSGMQHHVAVVRTNVSEEHIVTIIEVERISELQTTLAVTSNCSTLQRNTFCMRTEAIEWDKG
jgi:hypothetical protein